MLLNSSAGPVPGPCASRVMVPSSMFQSTSASISRNSPARFERLHPAAHVAEGDGFSFDRHHFSFTANRSAGGAISVTRSRTSFLLDSGASRISRGSSRAVQA